MNRKIFLFLFMVSFCFGQKGYSQNMTVSDNESYTGAGSAILDVFSTTKGLLIPRLSSEQKADLSSTAIDGMLVYDVDEKKIYLFHTDGISSEWVPLSENNLWVLDTLKNAVYLRPDSVYLGIGTSFPEYQLEVNQDIKSGERIIVGPSSLNFKKDRNNDSIPGIQGYSWDYSDNLEGWQYWPGMSPESASVDSVLGNHLLPCKFSASQASPSNMSPSFCAYKEYTIDSLDTEIWIWSEDWRIMLGLIKMPTGPDEEPPFIACISPDFDNNSNNGGLLGISENSENDEYDFNSHNFGRIKTNTWNHLRLKWKKSQYFRVYLNHNLCVDIDGSELSPDAFIIGGYSTLWFDALGMEKDAYVSSTNTGYSYIEGITAKFDQIITPTGINISDFFSSKGGIINGDVILYKEYSSDYDDDGSSILLSLVSEDSLGNINKLEIENSSYINADNLAWSDLDIISDAALNFQSKAGNFNITMDSSENDFSKKHSINLFGEEVDCTFRRTGMQILAYLEDTASVYTHSISAINYSNSDDQDTIISWMVSGEDYTDWYDVSILMIDGSMAGEYFYVDTTVVSTYVNIILDSYISDEELSQLNTGDKFVILNSNEGHSLDLYTDINKNGSTYTISHNICSNNDSLVIGGGNISVAGQHKILLHSSEKINIEAIEDITMSSGSGQFHYSTGGNLGIGFANSPNKLGIAGGIQLQSSNPTNTSMALYNNNGDLYWNGSPLGNNILPEGTYGETLRCLGGHIWESSNLVYNNGSYVGIGTTTPDELLSVNGVISLQTSSTPSGVANKGKIYVKEPESSTQLYYMDNNGQEFNLTSSCPGGLDTYVQFNESGGLQGDEGFRYNKSDDLLFIGGSLGIGSTQPAYPLEVAGTIASGNNDADGELRLFANSTTDHFVSIKPSQSMTENTTYYLPDDNGDYGQVLSSDGNGNLSWSDVTSGSGSPSQVAFWNSLGQLDGSDMLCWKNTNGRLGIGITTPAYPLDVNGAIRTGMTGTDGQICIFSEEGEPNHAIFLNPPEHMSNSTSYYFPENYGSDGASLTTDASGCLSWEQRETPIYFSNGVIRDGNTVTLGGSLNKNISTDLGSYNMYYNLSSGGSSFRVISNETTSLYINYLGNVGIGTNYTEGRLVVSGNVGINTSTPQFELDVKGSIRSGGSGKDGKIVIYSDQDGTNHTVSFSPQDMDQSIDYLLPENEGNNGDVLTTDGTGTLSWDVSPAANLNFTNGLTRNSDNITLGGNLTKDTYITHASYSLTHNLTLSGAFEIIDGSEKIFFTDTSGNIGIGTTQAVHKLDIEGDISIRSGNCLLSEAIKAPNNNGLGLYNNYGDGLFINDNGYVGIGTTVADKKLCIAGLDFDGSSVQIERYNETYNCSPALLLSRSKGASIGYHSLLQHGDYLGELRFNGSNGTSFAFGADIFAQIDGTPAASAALLPTSMWFRVSDGTTLKTPLIIRKDATIGINLDDYPYTNFTHSLNIKNQNSEDVLRLIGPETNGYGARINFGDEDNIYFEEDADNKLEIYSSGRTAVRGGNVVIGSGEPLSRLTVDGSISPSADNSYDLGTSSYRWQDIYATNGVIQTSDISEIKNIQNLEPGLDFVCMLKPLSYLNSNSKDNQRHYGLLASDIEKLFNDKCPGLIYHSNSYGHATGIRYNEIIPLLINAIKELNNKNQTLNTEIENLKRKQDLFEQELIKLKQHFKTQKE